MLRFGGVKKELFGFDPRTTNNRMELMAAIQGLLALKEPCEVEITTDSEYLLSGITKWITKWKRRHWWRKNEPVSNADLWMELDELAALHKTTAAQRSSWADGQPHAPLRLGLGADYVGPKPQGSLFYEVEAAGEDEDDTEAFQKPG
jgi:ribonuclease HI